MFHFCITNQLKLVKEQYKNRFTCQGYYVSYDDHVWLYESTKYFTLFCGILWEGTIEEVIEQSVIPNGQFYSISIDKHTGDIIGSTDFLDDFSIYYYQKDNALLLTTDIINIRSTINRGWVQRYKFGKICDSYFSPLPNDHPIVNTRKTILDNVFRVGAAIYFKFTTDTYEFTPYLNSTYFTECFESKYSFDDLCSISGSIIKDNIKKVAEKYDKLVVMSGSGVDSMQIVSNLCCMPYEFDVVSYKGDWWINEIVPKYLDNQKIHRLSRDDYLNLSKKAAKYWVAPWRAYDYSAEVNIYRESIDEDAVVLNGTYGDEVYWHEPWQALAMCIFYRNYSFEETVEFLAGKYLGNNRLISEILYNEVKECNSFQNAIIKRLYYRPSYLKGLRVVANRLIISPFIDLRLKTLLNRCDRDAQERSCFDVEVQKKLITPSLLEYVNAIKAGTEEGSDEYWISDEHPNINLLKYFIRNYNG